MKGTERRHEKEQVCVGGWKRNRKRNRCEGELRDFMRRNRCVLVVGRGTVKEQM